MAKVALLFEILQRHKKNRDNQERTALNDKNYPIKPCPFCDAYINSTNGGVDYHYYDYRTTYIMCYNCHAKGPERETDEEALNAWNEWKE